MAFLDRANFALKPQHGCAVFAQDACRRWNICKGGMITPFFCRQRLALFRSDFLIVLTLNLQDLSTILAGAAVGRWVLAHLFRDALRKGFQNFRVIAQIPCFDEINVCVFGSHLIGKAINTVDQNA